MLAFLGAPDAAVIVALLGFLGTLAEMVRRQGKHAKRAASAAQVTANSVGPMNGAGTLQEQMVDLRQKWLDAEEKRQNGQQRQQELQTGQTEILQVLADRGDKLDALTSRVDHLSELIGESEAGWDQTPLLPYVHGEVHGLRNELTKIRLLLEHAGRRDEGGPNG